MGLVRIAWPDIKAALELGHTLRVVHQRLIEAGVQIEYRQLSVYIGRIERKSASPPAGHVLPVLGQAKDPVRPAPRPPQTAMADPLVNVRERAQKPPGFRYEDEPADESKLI